MSRTRARVRALLLPLVVAATAAATLVAPAGAAPAPAPAGAGAGEQSVTLVNRDQNGDATIRFDVDGEAIDAHDGQIQRFGETYYLYGTSYDCGYEWNTPGAPFCGFVSYSSPDLVHWTAQGPLFDATTPAWQERCDGGTYGCYRPHVVHNESTGRYVLWVNTYDVGVGYRVLTATSPTGPFTEEPVPDLGIPEGAPGGVNYGDHQVFVDHDGTAYLSFTDWLRGGDIVVEKLDSTYTTGSGEWSRVDLRSTEAPTIFERDGTYYLTYSDPNRGYATTGTGYVTAPTPLGPWTGTGSTPGPWQVADGVLSITGGDAGLSLDGADWTDYTFTATVTPQRAASGDYAQVGLVVRAGASGSYQWLIGNYPHAGASGGNLTRLVPGKPAAISKLPFDIVTGQTYEVAITVSGSTIETRIDGVLVDTTTDATSAAGRVGFREGGSDGERVDVDEATVTAADGTVLLHDDFDGGLAQWDRPEKIITGTNITTTSCGGQPTDVLPIETSAGTVYLYQSDVWMEGKANEALAKHYWQPLEFDGTGAIEPIGCGASYDVTVPVGDPVALPEAPAVTTGDAGFRTHWDVAGGLARSQGFTVPERGLLSAARFTTFQSGHPDAPLTLNLRRLGDDGTPGESVASVDVPADEVGWAARWVEVAPAAPLPVEAGDRFAVVVGTAATRGAYGIAYSDTTPYAGGAASISHDGGATWAAEPGRVLHLEADVLPPAAVSTSAPRVSGEARVGSTLRASTGGWDAPGLTFAYRWLRDGTPVAGATTATYRPTARDVGHRLVVRVTASGPGVSPATASSAATPKVVRATSRTRLAATTTRVAHGVRARLVARVASRGPVAGRVAFVVDGRVVRTARLADGRAATRLRLTEPGRHRVVVRYLGTSGVAPSASPARTIRVRR